MSPDSHFSINNSELVKDVMRGFKKLGMKQGKQNKLTLLQTWSTYEYEYE